MIIVVKRWLKYKNMWIINVAVTHKIDANTVFTEYSKLKIYVKEITEWLGKKISLETSRITAEEEDVECFPNIIKPTELIFVVPISKALYKYRFLCMNWIEATFRFQLHQNLLDDLKLKCLRGPIHQFESENAMKL